MKFVKPCLKQVALGVIGLALLAPHLVFAPASAQGISHPPLQETLTLVNDYWIKTNSNGGGRGPARAVYQMGNLALYSTFCSAQADNRLPVETCDAYIKHALTWASRNVSEKSIIPWELADEKKEADNQAAGQVFIELYEICQQEPLSEDLDQLCKATSGEKKLASITRSIDLTIKKCLIDQNDPQCQREGRGNKQYNWSWIDAIFMASPVLSKFGSDPSLPHNLPHADGDYFETLSKLYNETKKAVF